MAGLDKRLDRLEERQEQRAKASELSEEQARRHWLAVARVRRNEDRDRQEERARDLIRTLLLQGRLPKTTEELRDRLLAWRPPVDPRAVERALAKAIHEGEEGLEGMECPPEPRESFEAADELRDRYMAVPDETLAKWALWQHDIEEGDGDEEIEARLDLEAGEHGLTEELMLKAIGPDSGEIGDEEAARRLREILADLYHSPKGYEIQQHIDTLIRERSNA